MSFSRRSTLREVSFLVVALVVLSTLSSAQHSVAPTAHSVAPPARVYTPPVFHMPVIQSPPLRAPAISSPIYSPLRNTPIPSLGSAVVLPPRRPIRPIRPFPPVILIYTYPFPFGGYWPFNLCWWSDCDLLRPWAVNTFSVSSPGPINYVSPIYETPVYVYGSEREDLPQLYMNDGTILNVNDYWVIDDQLHFTIVEQTGAKPVEHSISFEELDLQKTIDANTSRGFRFVLRNQPFEQSVRDHPQGPPEFAPPSHQ